MPKGRSPGVRTDSESYIDLDAFIAIRLTARSIRCADLQAFNHVYLLPGRRHQPLRNTCVVRVHGEAADTRSLLWAEDSHDRILVIHGIADQGDGSRIGRQGLRQIV
jgi:hypothetical protein